MNLVHSSPETGSPIRINSCGLELLDPEDKGTTILRNSENCSLSDTASLPEWCESLSYCRVLYSLTSMRKLKHTQTHTHTHTCARTHIKASVSYLKRTLVYIFLHNFNHFHVLTTNPHTYIILLLMSTLCHFNSSGEHLSGKSMKQIS
jgi:hypothetical protein